MKRGRFLATASSIVSLTASTCHPPEAEAGLSSQKLFGGGLRPVPAQKLTRRAWHRAPNRPSPQAVNEQQIEPRREAGVSYTGRALSLPLSWRYLMKRETVETDTWRTDDMHVVCPRAAGLDVHKMCITAAVRVCEAGGGPARTAVREFSALPDGLRAMTEWLRGHGVTAATMEGTGVYWKAPFEALEEAGIRADLLHAQHVKECDPQCKTSYVVEPTCSFGSGTESGGLRVSFLVEHSCDSCVVGQRVKSARLVQSGHDDLTPQQSPLGPLPHGLLRNTQHSSDLPGRSQAAGA